MTKYRVISKTGEVLEVLNGKEIVKRLDAEMDATALTAKNTELREQLDKIDLIAYQALVDSGVIEPAQPSDRSVK